MKVYDLKPGSKQKKKSPEKETGMLAGMASMKNKLAGEFAQKFLGLVEIHISNVHVRYEDAVTQGFPMACGFKLGFLSVTSQADPKELRTTGEWRHAREQ